MGEREGERGYYSSQPATVNKCFSVNNEDLVLPNEEAYMVTLKKTMSLNISAYPYLLQRYWDDQLIMLSNLINNKNKAK